MNIVFLMIPIAIALGSLFALGFAWMAYRGQYDELETPASRILVEDTPASRTLIDPKREEQAR